MRNFVTLVIILSYFCSIIYLEITDDFTDSQGENRESFFSVMLIYADDYVLCRSRREDGD